MGIGLGVVMLLVGLILVFGAINLPASIDNAVDATTLGWLLVIAGVVALVLAVVMNNQRHRQTTVVEERRIDDGRP